MVFEPIVNATAGPKKKFPLATLFRERKTSFPEKKIFLAPSGAQGVTILVRPSVRSVQVCL